MKNRPAAKMRRTNGSVEAGFFRERWRSSTRRIPRAVAHLADYCHMPQRAIGYNPGHVRRAKFARRHRVLRGHHVGLGSWANTQTRRQRKMAFRIILLGLRHRVFLFSLIFAHTLGVTAARE